MTAALQDWDAIYAFAYAHTGNWNARHVQGFFDIGQHPTKMATLPAAVALFMRGDVKPAQQQVVAAMDRNREIDLLPGAVSPDAGAAGELLQRRVHKDPPVSAFNNRRLG